ncbi:hypothetical protein [Jiangella aurantiaca]|nr:hypothetical protein [Jiangella aurantiaca]
MAPGNAAIYSTIARIADEKDGLPVELNGMTLDASVYLLRYEFDA